VELVPHFVPEGGAPEAPLHDLVQGAPVPLPVELKERYTVAIVTHNMQQAARISDVTAFFLLGELIEMGPTADIFTSPEDRRTEDYITGRFG